MKKFISLFLISFLYITNAYGINSFKYLDEPLSGEFCSTLLDDLKSSPNLNFKETGPIIINTELLIEDINKIDGKTLDFESSFTLWNFWIDQKVVRLLKERGAYEETDKPAWICDYPPDIFWGDKQKSVFDPVIEFYNRKTKPDFQTGLADWVEIFNNGTIQTRVRDISPFKLYNTDFRKFPFDTQEMEFQLYPEFPKTMVQFQADEPTMTGHKQNLYNFQGESGIEIPGWNLVEVDYYVDEYTEGDYDYQGFVLTLKAERIASYYVFKVILPIFFILIISWSVFWVRGSELEAKVNVTIVCLLALIAYNFIIDGDLPKLDYLTFLDLFILVSYFYTGLATILCVHSFIRHKKTGEIYTAIDIKARMWGPISFLLILITLIYGFFN